MNNTLIKMIEASNLKISDVEHIVNEAQRQAKIPDWKPASTLPDVPKGEAQIFWIAIKSGEGEEALIEVYKAQYVNKPLVFDDDDIHHQTPIYPCFMDENDNPVEAVGWYWTDQYCNEYSCWFNWIRFSAIGQLVGWAEYVPPQFAMK